MCSQQGHEPQGLSKANITGMFSCKSRLATQLKIF